MSSGSGLGKTLAKCHQVHCTVHSGKKFDCIHVTGSGAVAKEVSHVDLEMSLGSLLG